MRRRVLCRVNLCHEIRICAAFSSTVYITASSSRWCPADRELAPDWLPGCQSPLFTSNVVRWNFPGYSTDQ